MTKLAIIADIHANLVALESTLADIKTQSITNILCLGDVGNFGPQPKETLELIREIGCPVVMGNSDANVLKPRQVEKDRLILEVESWCAEQLQDEHKAFVRTFKPIIELELDNLKILAYHGSPKSYNDPITATTSDEVLETYFANYKADIFMGGHTHEQFIKRYFDKRVLNPGSVGLPYVMKRGSSAGLNLAVAEYAILEVIKGEPNVTFRRVRYDVSNLEKAVRASKMPHGEHWLNWQ
jgi:putative phosphoesterase